MTEEEQQQAAPEAAAGAAGDWVEQTQAMTSAWLTAQSQLWNDWAAAVQPTAAAVAGGNFVGDWMQQWQALARTSLGGWTAESGDEARELATRLLTGEQAFLSFVEMAFGMMKAVAPKIDVGDDWKELLRRFLGQMREDMLRGQSAWASPGSGAAATTGDVTELWRLYSLEMQRFFGPWGAAYRDAAVNMGEVAKGDPTAIHKTFAGFLDAYELTFGRFFTAPSIGYSREPTERLLKGFDAWVEMNRAAVDFETELANTGMHAQEALMGRLVDMGEKGEHITTLRGFFDLWVDTLEKAYYELFGSESFATLQGRYVNASLLFRRRQGELLDELMDTVGLPGRKEVDQLHRHVHDLRIEVRWTKREMRALRRELKEKAESEAGPAEEKPSVKPAKSAKPGTQSAAKAAPAAAKRQRRPTAADPKTPRP